MGELGTAELALIEVKMRFGETLSLPLRFIYHISSPCLG
jgi:hypothetical protein